MENLVLTLHVQAGGEITGGAVHVYDVAGDSQTFCAVRVAFPKSVSPLEACNTLLNEFLPLTGLQLALPF